MEPTASHDKVAVVSTEIVSDCPQIHKAGGESYGQILKSSALIGGSQILNIAIGIVRTKAMAMFLGPAGFGLAALYTSIIDLTQNIAGMGVNSSGVRQIAEAVGSDNANRITITVAVLRRTSIVLGLFGALALLVLCRPISTLTFGTSKYASSVAVLSVAAFCKLASGGQGALIQGMRRISDLAKMTVFGSVLGTCAGVALVYLFREEGIVPYLMCVAAMSVATSWWYSNKIHIPRVSISSSQLRQEAAALLKLGFAFMISSLMTLGVAYVIRVIILRKVGIEGTGLYQSAWTLGGMYVGLILQSMGADFYPRLTGSINDHNTCNRLVNEQARVGLLLAGPGVIATLTFAPVVIATLYSPTFAASVPILRYVCLGAFLQVISWPMGFIIVAKGKQNLFIFSEVAWAIVSLGLALQFTARFGVVGAGIAFFASYVFHVFLTYGIVTRLSGFRWSSDNLRTGSFYCMAVAAVFLSSSTLPFTVAVFFGMFVLVVITVYSLCHLAKDTMSERYIPRLFRRALQERHLSARHSSS